MTTWLLATSILSDRISYAIGISVEILSIPHGQRENYLRDPAGRDRSA